MNFILFYELTTNYSKLSDCGIDSSCNYFKFRYRTCFKQKAPWYSGNYNVWFYSTRMQHDKNTQLKSRSLLYSVLLSYFIYSRVREPQTLHGRATTVAHNKNWRKVISIHLIRKKFPGLQVLYSTVKRKSHEKLCLPNWFITSISHGHTE